MKVDPAIELERKRKLVILQDVACSKYAHQKNPSLSEHDLILSTADTFINDGKPCACKECLAMTEARLHLFPDGMQIE